MTNIRGILRIFAVFAIVYCLPTLPGSARAAAPQPTARDGIIDLRHWDFERDGQVSLAGEWIFVPQALLTPDGFNLAGDRAPRQVPDDWSRTPLSGDFRKGTGFATYGLRVLLSPDAPDVGLDLGSLYYASRVFINGELIRQNGTPGTSRQTTRATAWPGSGRVLTHAGQQTPDELVIVVQISNFTHAQGGFRSVMAIGDDVSMAQQKTFDLVARVLLIGAALALALYHIILFRNRPDEWSFPAFATYLIAISLHAICGMSLGYNMFPEANANVMLRMEYLSLVIGTISAVHLVWLLFPEICWRPAKAALYLYTATMVSIILTTDTYFFTGLLALVEAGILAGLIIMAASLIVAWSKGLAGAAPFLATMIVTAFGALFGIWVHIRTGAATNSLVYLCLSTMIVGQAVILGRKLAATVRASKELSVALEHTNAGLKGQTELLKQTASETQVALEKARDASRIKTAFLGTMSHEIRTPVHSILGTVSLLEKGALNDGQAELLEVARQSGQSLLTVLSDILDISRLEAGELALELNTIDLPEILRSCINTWNPVARDKGLKLEGHCALDADCGLVGDERRLHQILSNLISNAIKFTEDGEIRVEINVRASTNTTADLDICVSDTGIGIAEDARNSLFMPFLQGDGSTTRQHGGTGLGLAICKRLAEAMGGQFQLLIILLMAGAPFSPWLCTLTKKT